MLNSTPIVLTWSGGKDSAMALQALEATGSWHVTALLTTVTDAYDRVSMHGVRRRLLACQARALDRPLEEVVIHPGATDTDYERRMAAVLGRQRNRGVREVAFGDIFLEDLRRYREENLARIGLRGLFPLWGESTKNLSRSFIYQGFKAVVTCVDSRVLGREFVGRDFDEEFLADLPQGVDPCGENGEFHSFVFDGPLFSRPVRWQRGKVVLREGRFWYVDLIPPGERADADSGAQGRPQSSGAASRARRPGDFREERRRK